MVNLETLLKIYTFYYGSSNERGFEMSRVTQLLKCLQMDLLQRKMIINHKLQETLPSLFMLGNDA